VNGVKEVNRPLSSPVFILFLTFRFGVGDKGCVVCERFHNNVFSQDSFSGKHGRRICNDIKPSATARRDSRAGYIAGLTSPETVPGFNPRASFCGLQGAVRCYCRAMSLLQ